MSLHIQRFLDRIRTAESRRQGDIIMTLQEARDLHTDITRLLMRLEERSVAPPAQPEVIEVEVRGRPF